MKHIIVTGILLFLLFSCKSPRLLLQDDQKYQLQEWEGGDFYYITYYWEGGKFEDAILLIEELIHLAEERGHDELVIGRFPGSREWQLGLIARQEFTLDQFQERPVSELKIPAGTYASMLSQGYPERIFVFWSKLKKWLIQDDLKVISPVFEIYTDAFNKNKPVEERIGELRYQINQN